MSAIKAPEVKSQIDNMFYSFYFKGHTVHLPEQSVVMCSWSISDRKKVLPSFAAVQALTLG